MNDNVHRTSFHALRLKRLGIDTYQEPVIYMRSDCHVCRAEGFEAQSRVQVTLNNHSIIATLNVVTGDLLAPDEAGLSEAAWRLLGARAGDAVALSHPPVLESLSRVRAKVYGKRLGDADMRAIMRDVAAGRYADIHLSAFLAACAGDRLDLDSEGQLVASVLSEKAAAGSSHVVIDIPVGDTAKVRSRDAAQTLSHRLVEIGRIIGLTVQTVVTDGAQPVGRGIGPALEARDVLAVLRREADAPVDLRERALRIAGAVLEFAPGVAPGAGVHLAREFLDDGRAWKKFEAICAAQGGLREPPVAAHTHAVTAAQCGRVTGIDNRWLARVAKLAGAPRAPAAGLELHVPLGTVVEQGQPLFTVHAEAPGELAYALDNIAAQPGIVRVEAEP
ncbi:hypothetical protein ABW22_12535 [Thiobacillus denitrificans]|uniref:Pyrimidine nucleoside phosphorylase C-terminal domain-containing protein n=2 Tax=Thiobacillus denitrificans TaxID=36861 RepID=A0A106BKY7_THIDE|nr:hypothetical protein ABW22_12535 [Thiobacillus denitrificans]